MKRRQSLGLGTAALIAAQFADRIPVAFARGEGLFLGEAREALEEWTRAAVARDVRLPPGYVIGWSGRFENQERAERRERREDDRRDRH